MKFSESFDFHRGKHLTGWICLALVMCLFTAPALSEFEGHQWYLGVSVGSSTIEPDRAETSVDTTDDSDTALKLTIGQELSDHISAEAFAVDLGKARLENGGEVSYRGYGAGLQLSVPNNNSYLSAFAKGGLAYFDITADVPVDFNTDLETFAGAGVELKTESGFTFRGEYEFYNGDAQQLSLGVLRRFGKSSDDVLVMYRSPQQIAQYQAAQKKKAQKELAQNERENPVAAPVAPINMASIDSSHQDQDKDGVLDSSDKCLSTPPGVQVSLVGCANFLGVVRGITFQPNSDYLDAKSKITLDTVVANMGKYSNQQFVIVGHTDNTEGLEGKRLSLKRALIASRHLVSKGIKAKQLRFAGLGDTKPRVSNRTEKGRAYNRRIEIYLAARKNVNG